MTEQELLSEAFENIEREFRNYLKNYNDDEFTFKTENDSEIHMVLEAGIQMRIKRSYFDIECESLHTPNKHKTHILFSLLDVEEFSVFGFPFLWLEHNVNDPIHSKEVEQTPFKGDIIKFIKSEFINDFDANF